MPTDLDNFKQLTETGKHRALTDAELRVEKLQELLKLARDAMKSAGGNLIAADTKIADYFKEVVSKQ